MKKSLLALLLSLSLASMTLSGCSGDTEETKQIVKDDESKKQTEATKPGETEAGTDTPATEAPAQAPEKSGDITIEETKLIDQDGIIITAKSYESDLFMGDGIKLLLENNSDKDVMVGCNALIVNNYMINDLFACELAAGKKANETMYLSSTELKAAGIDSVGQVEIYFHVYDNATWDTIFDSEQVLIKTSAYDNMDVTADESGVELYNKNGIRILGKTVDENSFWGKAILLYAENESKKNVTISCDDLSINGFMMDPLFSCTVYSGKKAFNEITLMSSDLEANGIETVEDVELKFHIFDAKTFDTIDNSDAIKFSAQ